MTDFIEEFREHMRANGFEPKGSIIADDKWHQAYYNGERGSDCSGTYSLKIEGDRAIGCYFTRKDPDNKFPFSSASAKKFTAEEKKEFARLRKLKEQEKEAAEKLFHEKISRRLTKVIKNMPKASDDHPYLKRKGVSAHGLRLRKKGNELVMPLYGTDGKLYTIQRITEDGGKYLFRGGKKQGSYYPLATSTDDLGLLLLTEGFATGASVRAATAYPVIVSIDSGNLKQVAHALRSKYPKSRIVFCADNDAYTKNAKGDLWNVGEEKAKEAAASIGGAYVIASKLVNDKNTDFNDMHAALGLEAVKEYIVSRIPADPVQQGEAAVVDESAIPDAPDQPHNGGDYIDEEFQGPSKKGDFGMNFRVLGYNNGVYYYFPFGGRQIVALTPPAHTLPNLFRLDSLDNWISKFWVKGEEEKVNEKKMVMYSTNALIDLATKRGVFKEEDTVRGCGAYIDAGRKILHCGDVLYVDGKETKFDDLDSKYVYIASKKLMTPNYEPLSTQEAYALRQICEMVTWENKLSGALLAGWLVIAPICGALSFRPHIWVTGEAESGKSTVLDRIIKPVLGDMAVNTDGGTSEPGVRQMMENDARPLVYDEAEKSAQMPAILELARKASTGGNVKKFGQGLMKVRFAACFSSISPPVNKVSDESRISFLLIKKNRRPTAMEEFDALVDKIESTITPDYSSRMISRTLKYLDVLFDNIVTFKRAARRVVKGARASEMIGTMLAGLYLLHSTNRIDADKAQEFISKYDWTNHTIIDDDADPARLLQYISSCVLRMQSHGGGKEVSIGDLIMMAYKGDEVADKLLRYHGMAVKNGKVHIANRSQHMAKLLKDTDWDSKWAQMLSNFDGAEKIRIFYFATGVKTSCIALPMKLFKEHEDQEELPRSEPQTVIDFSEEIPF